MNSEVFISYASKDRKRILDLVDRLSAAGVSVWIDQMGIEGATMWSQEIVAAIRDCKVLILAISKNSAGSENVVKEVALASEGRKRILPVYLEQADIPESMAYQLAGIQRVDFFEGQEELGKQSVIRALLKMGVNVSEEASSAASTNISSVGKGHSSALQLEKKEGTAWGKIAMALVGVVLLAVCLFFFLGSESEQAETNLGNQKDTINKLVSLDKNRIVVLPFKNIGESEENDHVVDGIVVDLNTMLSNIDDLKVIGSVSAKTYKDTTKSPIEIGKELSTGTLIQGSIQKAGHQLKINVQVVDTISGEINWAKNFEGNDTNLFNLQSQIVKSVSENLDGVFIDEKKLDAFKNNGTENPEAYAMVQKARELLYNDNSKISTKEAVKILKKAIILDPNYPDAYANLGKAYYYTTTTSSEYPIKAFPKAKEAYEKALKLKPGNPVALAGLSDVALFFERDFNKAKNLSYSAYSSGINNSEIITSYAMYLEALGDFEGIAKVIFKAIENDPKSPRHHQRFANANYVLGNMHLAEKHNNIALSLSPSFQWALHLRSIILTDQHKFKAAEDLLIQGIKDDPDNPVSLMSLGVVYWKWGRKEQAQNQLLKLLHRSHFEYIKGDIISRFYAAIGDNEKTIQWIKEMNNRKEMSFLILHNHPWLKSFQKSEDFIKIYKNAGIFEELFNSKF